MSAQGPTTTLSGTRRGLVMLVVTMATAMTALDMTIAGIALPHMRGTFSATQDQVSWVMTSFIVAAAVTIPATGWLSNRFGRRPLFLTALTGFTVVSVLCGTAETLFAEVAFRALQGFFGAPIVPIAQSIILDIYPTEKHGRALSVWGFGIMLGPILGPIIGGYLTENFGWPWIFYINLPIGIATLAAAVAFIPAIPGSKDLSFDWFGFAALAVSVGALQLLLDRGERQDWFDSREIVVEAVVIGLAFYLFLVHTLTRAKSFLNTEMLKDRNYTTGVVLTFLFGFVLMPPLLLLPPFLQDLGRFPSDYIGLVIAPRGFGVMIAMNFAGRIIERVDPRVVMLVGLAGMVVGGLPMTEWTLDVTAWDVVWTGTVHGFGMGLFYVPIVTVAFSTLDPRHRSDGTSLFQLMRNLGSSLSVSVFITVLARYTSINHAILSEHASPFNEAFDALPPGALWSLESARGLAALDAEITRQAAMIAYANDFYLLVFVTLATMPVVLLLRPVRRRARPTLAAAEA